MDETPMEATSGISTVDEESQPMDATTKITANKDDDELSSQPSQTVPPLQNLATSVPCSIVLKDVSDELKGRTSVRVPHTKEEMCKAKVYLKQIDHVDNACLDSEEGKGKENMVMADQPIKLRIQ